MLFKEKILDKLLNQALNKTNDFLEKLREKSKQLNSILKNKRFHSSKASSPQGSISNEMRIGNN